MNMVSTDVLCGLLGVLAAGNRMDQFSAALLEQIKCGDTNLLTVGHVMSCGLKVRATDLATAGIETARRVRQNA